MPGGTNHAKQIVLDEANDLVKKLQNGNDDDPKLQGQATALILKMITPIYEAEFVTVEDCKKKHGANGDLTEVSFGSLKVKGRINAMIISMILLTFGVVFAIGKSEGWW